MTLRLDWASYEAAKYAVTHWHYSKSMPTGKLSKIGVWESEQYIGAVIFARGSNKHIGLPFGLLQTECVELIRVALNGHTAPVSRIISIAVRLLCRLSPKLRLIVSFADSGRGHIGTIYQAAGWVYVGLGTKDPRSRPYQAPNGSIQHWRTVAGTLSKCGLQSTLGDAVKLGYKPLSNNPKHRYLYPLDDDMRRQIEPLRKPYPKRADSVNSSTAGVQPDGGGANPTSALLEPEAANG